MFKVRSRGRSHENLHLFSRFIEAVEAYLIINKALTNIINLKGYFFILIANRTILVPEALFDDAKI